ncbi:unnamed protein product [Merluccius merluccius]
MDSNASGDAEVSFPNPASITAVYHSMEAEPRRRTPRATPIKRRGGGGSQASQQAAGDLGAGDTSLEPSECYGPSGVGAAPEAPGGSSTQPAFILQSAGCVRVEWPPHPPSRVRGHGWSHPATRPT